jgi:hypothetical protein
MKKIYLQPELEIIKVQTMQMMAASLPIVGTTVTDEDVLAPEMDDLDSYFE